MSTRIKLAEALLRRKELQEKVTQLGEVKNPDLYVMIFDRKKATEDLDDIAARVPRATYPQITAAFDFYSKQLRLIDGVIQQSNWTTEIELPVGATLADYTEDEALTQGGIPMVRGTLGSTTIR